ncbi:barwin-like endoglucanase [Fusarium acutatum]|uniref:Barwin-like endoglucanase n=1 Tax=Fusarium acutatum TaxID=78861 RepID=A0A8H4JS51_9HYPO|nr:barwin-like endoglucanase [Fusarium acutatum]
MYFSNVSAALLGLAIGIQDVAAGPCKPESSQTLTESSLGATGSVFDAGSTVPSIVSATETTQTRPENEISSTVSLGSSPVEVTSATASNTESVSTATEFLESSTALPSTARETTDPSITIGVSESSTTLPSTIEGTASSATTEASESITDFSSTNEATSEVLTSFATSLETSQASTILPSTTEEAPSTSTAPANEQPQIFTGGSATWVYQDGIMGDCGSVSRDTDFVVALDYRRYDRSKCGQKIRVTATSGRRIGLSIDVTIVDVCYVCVNENSMDLSTAAFNAFGPLDDARVNVKWQYLP